MQDAGERYRRARQGFWLFLLRVAITQVAGAGAFVAVSQFAPDAAAGEYLFVLLASTTLYGVLTGPLTWTVLRAPEAAVFGESLPATMAACVAVPGLALAAVAMAFGAAPGLCLGLAAWAVVMAAMVAEGGLQQRTLRFSRLAKAEGLERVVFYGAVALLALLGAPTVWIGPALVVAAICGFAVIAPQRFYLKAPSLRAARRVLSRAGWPQIAFTLAALTDVAAVPVLSLVTGGHEASLLAWAMPLAFAPQIVASATTISLTPAFVGQPADNVDHRLRSSMRAAAYVQVGAGMIILGAVPHLFGLLGDRWEAALPSLVVLSCAMVISGTAAPLYAACAAQSSIKAFTITQLVSWLCGLSLGWAASGELGAVGMALGILLGRLGFALAMSFLTLPSSRLPALVNVVAVGCAYVPVALITLHARSAVASGVMLCAGATLMFAFFRWQRGASPSSAHCGNPKPDLLSGPAQEAGCSQGLESKARS